MERIMLSLFSSNVSSAYTGIGDGVNARISWTGESTIVSEIIGVDEDLRLMRFGMTTEGGGGDIAS